MPAGLALVPATALALAAFATLVHGQAVPLHAFPGTAPGEQAGAAVAVVGDIDGDGASDIAVGAPFANGGGAWSGEVRVHSGRSGGVLRTIPGGAAGDRFGVAVCGAGDVDGDGTPDLAIGAPYADRNGMDSGAVAIVSGRTWSLVRELAGLAPFEGFGMSLAAAGNVDGDAVDDLVVGAPFADAAGPDSGSAYVFAGATGALVRQWHGSGAYEAFGWRCAALGDTDNDQRADLAVSALQLPIGTGYVRVVSGGTGATRFTLFAGPTSKEYGIGLAGPGDTNNDGVPDVAVGFLGISASGFNGGDVRVYSGVDGSVLRSFASTAQYVEYGRAVVGVGDLDGDNAADLAIGQAGRFEVRSGGTGALLRTVDGDSVDWFVKALAVGDVDGDGAVDVVTGAPLANVRGPQSGAAFVFGLRPRSLAADRHAIPLRFGGTQALVLSAGAAHAGRTYLLLGSVSGTAPPIALGAVTLPLAFDGWLSHTLSQPNTPPLFGAFGTLDGAGGGTAGFAVGPNVLPPALAGFVFHHAFVVVDAGGQPVFASNPVSLLLQK